MIPSVFYCAASFLFLIVNNIDCQPHIKPLSDMYENFLWGTAICEFQNSGSTNLPHSNWAKFEKQGNITNHEKSGLSVDHWNQYEQDIQLMKTLGTNSFRFSIDWSAIEPQQGHINSEAIAHYHGVCKALVQANIKPMITLHHFTHPVWFDERGGWEKEENITHFVNFCSLVFKEFCHYKPLWCTINEPAIHAFTGYFLGIHSPGKTFYSDGIGLCGIVMKNLLQAHVQTYQTLKKLPGGDEAQIGIVHNALSFKQRNWWNPFEHLITEFLTDLTHNIVIKFLSTGRYDFSVLGCCKTEYVEPSATQSYDFIGLNYYADAVIGLNWSNIFGATCFPDQIMGDMDLPIDSQGFKKAILQIANLSVPIYITENGLADNLDINRPTMLKQYIAVIDELKQYGINIKGYYHWTLVDNFEWDRGTTVKFGLFDVKRNPKQSAQTYRDLIDQRISANNVNTLI